MPETLQKLHESSKAQEQNQTAISQKIYEIQQRIESFEKEVCCTLALMILLGSEIIHNNK